MNCVPLSLRVALLVASTVTSLMSSSLALFCFFLPILILISRVLRTPWKLLAIALIAPAPGIVTSHFLIEPVANGYTLDWYALNIAVVSYLRLACLAIMSVAFLSSLSLTDVVAISAATRAGSWLLMAWLLVNSSISAARIEYENARIQLAFLKIGNARRRSSLSFLDMSHIGIAMCLILLVRAVDIASMARGRGILLKQTPIPLQRKKACK